MKTFLHKYAPDVTLVFSDFNRSFLRGTLRRIFPEEIRATH